MTSQLSPDQCILLAVHFACDANVESIRSLTRARSDAFDPEYLLRILLTYLPATLDPREYTAYVDEIVSSVESEARDEGPHIDLSPVQHTKPKAARHRVKALPLLDLGPNPLPDGIPNDLLTYFVYHRAHRIDSESGLLNLIPHLLEPFLDRNEFLRTWYVSVILPATRLQFEYYPGDEEVVLSLAEFEALAGREGLDFLLKKATERKQEQDLDSAAAKTVRDIRCLVGPWMYGDSQRKRRKLSHDDSVSTDRAKPTAVDVGVQLAEEKSIEPSHEGWDDMFHWIVSQSYENFSLVTKAIEGWSGPVDVDLGDHTPQKDESHISPDIQEKLKLGYAQAALASCYAVSADTENVIRGAHTILGRIAQVLDFVRPPDLDNSIESLPRIDEIAAQPTGLESIADFEPKALLRRHHPLTTPTHNTYVFLQLLVNSAYQFMTLNEPISVVKVARLHFFATPEELLTLLRKILKGLINSGARRDGTRWIGDRKKLLWLRNWDTEFDNHVASTGAGVLGRIARQDFEAEMLRSFLETSNYELGIDTYLKSSVEKLSKERVEHIVLQKAMEAYDGASNGNKTRGAMKKANDIITAFRPFFPKSVRFAQASALISATHALSFYSLTLQHGVPFQPVSIRVNSDPVGLINKVLEQNPGSYTKVEDLISIGRNLAAAGLPQNKDEGDSATSDMDLEVEKHRAESRVLFMAIEAALREDDFETAYSYIISRSTRSGPDITQATAAAENGYGRNTAAHRHKLKKSDLEDDMSWRAAFLAGRHRPTNATPPSLRRLEQRTELLSLALLLAPVSALPEILAAWRRCEEETSAMQLAQQQAEDEFDDRADHRLSASASGLPGNFTVNDTDSQPALILNQKRREVGRMADRSRRGDAEAPVSMFDLTRSAAQALRQNAWSARGSINKGSAVAGHGTEGFAGEHEHEHEHDGDGRHRVRKRDMVANAASGALASGLGWVLGATPTSHAPQ